MNMSFKSLFSKCMEFIAALTLVYPTVLLLRWLFCDDMGGVSGVILGASSIMCGYITALYLKRYHKRILFIFLLVAAIAFFSVPVALLYLQISPGRAIFEVLSFISLFIIGMGGCYRGFYEIVSGYKLNVGMYSFFITLIIGQFTKAGIYILGLAYVFMVMFLFLRNENSMEKFFLRGEKSSETGAGKIKSKNRAMLLGVLLATTLLFVLAEPISKILFYIIAILKYVLLLILKLMNLHPDFGEYEMEWNPPFFPGRDCWLIALILTLILIGCTLFYIIRVTNINFRVIILKILEFLSKLQRLKKNRVVDGEDYFDEVEIVMGEGEDTPKRRKKKHLRDIKKGLKSIVNPVERVRYLYGALLELLVSKDVDIKKSHTTGEIYQKTIDINNMGNLLYTTTRVYDKIRYGAAVPDADEVLTVVRDFNSASELLGKM